MRECRAQGRLDLLPELRAFRCHDPFVPFLIADTGCDNTLLSGGVRSSRSAFAYAISRWMASDPVEVHRTNTSPLAAPGSPPQLSDTDRTPRAALGTATNDASMARQPESGKLPQPISRVQAALNGELCTCNPCSQRILCPPDITVHGVPA